MGDRIKELRHKSKIRRELLAQQFGLTSAEGISDAISSKEEAEERKAKKRKSDSAAENSLPAKKQHVEDDTLVDTSKGVQWIPPELKKEDKKEMEEAGVYTDSSAFLKGTQSANPHNDYCQNFVDTGERPQNYIRDVGLANRFEEYPKLRELIRLKDELIEQTNTPPMYLKCDLETFDLAELENKFDVILVEPPLEEYQRTMGVQKSKYWSWEEIEKLELDQVAAPRSFIWMWCGSSDGLDAGRKCLKKWGFRRCEDICWIKTNIKNPGHNKNLEPRAVFQRTKEHCLMGIKGTVRRSTDGDFIHANVDIDLIIDEEKEYGSDEKPIEIYHMIEHFCLGRRRLHIFGKDTTVRPGWLTIGPELTSSNFDAASYNSYFGKDTTGFTTGCSEEIERLRPKSPPAKNLTGAGNPQGGPRGGGAQRGGQNQRGGPAQRGGPQGRGGPGQSRGSWSRGGRGAFPRGRGAHRGGMQQR